MCLWLEGSRQRWLRLNIISSPSSGLIRETLPAGPFQVSQVICRSLFQGAEAWAVPRLSRQAGIIISTRAVIEHVCCPQMVHVYFQAIVSVPPNRPLVMMWRTCLYLQKKYKNTFQPAVVWEYMNAYLALFRIVLLITWFSLPLTFYHLVSYFFLPLSILAACVCKSTETCYLCANVVSFLWKQSWLTIQIRFRSRGTTETCFKGSGISKRCRVVAAHLKKGSVKKGAIVGKVQAGMIYYG